MSLLIDFSQIVIANFAVEAAKGQLGAVNESIVRHMILNQIGSLRNRFQGYKSNTVICCDGPNIWRKKAWPYYKAKRKKNKEESTLDWGLIHKMIDSMTDELRAYFPYHVIKVEGAEADDVIATLAKRFYLMGRDVMILSTDKDFKQLQMYSTVKQYSPVKREMVVVSDPAAYRRELIIRGDSGDGVPNILSPDDVLVTPGKRQVSMTQKRYEYFVNTAPSNYPEENLRYWTRNKMLVDLIEDVPKDISEAINQAYSDSTPCNGSAVLDYLMIYKLRNLSETMQELV